MNFARYAGVTPERNAMEYTFNKKSKTGDISPLIYGHFIEHFHRQIYGGLYDPQNPLSDEDGLRTDVLDAMRRIHVPVLRWPGGCFVSSYHWEYGVGKTRTPMFDKAWRVEDPNTFGTDEYVAACRKIGCEPYICTNAGTGDEEEMSNWVEYCNLENEGQYAKRRIANGFPQPHAVKYWSIGNENYGKWEIGAKSAETWGRLVLEAAKMMKHVDPDIELSAAALTDLDWNVNLLRNCGEFLDWISVHEYWDKLHQVNNYADYDACMAYTKQLPDIVRRVRGLLCAMDLDKKIKIAFDEWNLRGWHHPNAHTVYQGRTKEEYLYPRDLNDDNSKYTMADAVFAACFLNMCARNCDIVGMANFAPIVNTRGCIYTWQQGIVLRSTWHVFHLYTNYLGNETLGGWCDGPRPQLTVKAKDGSDCETEQMDLLPTYDTAQHHFAVAAVNKSADESCLLKLSENAAVLREARVLTVNGDDKDSYNDIGHSAVGLSTGKWEPFRPSGYELAPHSVNILQLRE